MAAFGRYRRYWISGLLIFFVCFYSYSVDTEEKKGILSPEYSVKVSSFYPERARFFTMEIGLAFEDLDSLRLDLPEFPESILAVEMRVQPMPAAGYEEFKSKKRGDEILVYSITFIALKEGRIRLDPARVEFPGGEIEIPLPVLTCVPPRTEHKPVISWKNLPSFFEEGTEYELSVETDFIPALEARVEYDLSPDFFIEELPLDSGSPLIIKKITLIPIKSGKAVLPVVRYIWSDEDYEYRVVLDKQTVEVKKQPRKNETPESIPAKNWKGNPSGDRVVEDFEFSGVQENSDSENHNSSEDFYPELTKKLPEALFSVRIPFVAGIVIFSAGIILVLVAFITLRIKKPDSKKIYIAVIVAGFIISLGVFLLRKGEYGTCGAGELYYIPDENSSLRQDIEKGSEVEILEDAGDWFLVRNFAGVEGWIKKENIPEVKKFW